MKNLNEKTLGEIVTDNYRNAHVFQKYQIDFCCKGKRTVQAACREKGIDARQVLNELALTGQSQEPCCSFVPESASLSELADYIVNTHHNYVRNELPRIAGQLQKVASKHGQRFPEMVEVARLLKDLKAEFELHMQKEETILFPRIKELEELTLAEKPVMGGIPMLESPILMMEQEHDHSGSIIALIRKLTNNYTPPTEACTTYKVVLAALEIYEMDLHRHVHLENNILFPRALKLLAGCSLILISSAPDANNE
jgi:regulator of cell morphogenesis and NO signaling